MHPRTDYPSLKTKELYKSILKLNNSSEAIKFFRDLLTIGEIQEFSIRFQIAKDLYNQTGSYQTIAKKHKVSTTTVTRVAHWLNHGMGGYKLILERIVKGDKM
jgi:TrpR-related protein YerC/YecD